MLLVCGNPGSEVGSLRRLELVTMSATELPKTYVLTDGEIVTVSAKRFRYVELLILPKTELDATRFLRALRREQLLDRRRVDGVRAVWSAGAPTLHPQHHVAEQRHPQGRIRPCRVAMRHDHVIAC